jgi:hypothetical protein
MYRKLQTSIQNVPVIIDTFLSGVGCADVSALTKNLAVQQRSQLVFSSPIPEVLKMWGASP